MLRLNEIKAHPGAISKNKRLGRGAGSGHGPRAGKGNKGQGARKSGNVRLGFEGGQTPLYRRVPKRGFTNFAKVKRAIVNVGQLEKLDLKKYPEITPETLLSQKVIKGSFDRLVVLGMGDLTKSVRVKAHQISPAAREKITKAGGEFELINVRS